MYFLQDIKQKGVEIQNVIEGEDKAKGITLYNTNNFETNVYEFKKEKKAIYRNGILICRNINNFKLEIDREIIDIYIETDGTAGFNKTMKYSINS